ncbi:phage/plasmid primase, P4 family [Weissella confusa]
MAESLNDQELAELEAERPEKVEKDKEQVLLEEFSKVAPVFGERAVYTFLKQKGRLNSRLLRNLTTLVNAEAASVGLNNEANLINTYQGVFNIQTKQLEPRGNRLFDHILPEYDSNAKAPAFSQLLNNYNTDEYPNLSTDLLKLFGYQLFGNNRLKTFFIIHGDGDNAKSTLWNLMENALGGEDVDGYATKLDSETFINKSSNFVVGLNSINNSRFLFSDELKQGVELEGNLIKQLVAGEGSTVKFEAKGNKKQQSANVISPVVLLVNDVPSFKNADDATRNRIAIVEFTKKFVRNDPEAAELIKQAKEEKAGIFNLIVNAYDPYWTVPVRWFADATSIVNAQADEDDEVYHLEQALPLVIVETGDTRDVVRRGELHQALKAKYYVPKEVGLPSTRRLAMLLPHNFNIGVHGNYYTQVELL